MPCLVAESRPTSFIENQQAAPVSPGHELHSSPHRAPQRRRNVVSADRLPIAVSERLDRAMADQLAAIASGVASLSQGAARYVDAGLVKQTMAEQSSCA